VEYLVYVFKILIDLILKKIMSHPLATLKPIQKFIASFVEDYEWYLKLTRKTSNYLPTQISKIVNELGIQNYSSLYVDKKSE